MTGPGAGQTSDQRLGLRWEEGEAVRSFGLLEGRQEPHVWCTLGFFFSLVKEARGICVQSVGGPLSDSFLAE